MRKLSQYSDKYGQVTPGESVKGQAEQALADLQEEAAAKVPEVAAEEVAAEPEIVAEVAAEPEKAPTKPRKKRTKKTTAG